MCQKTSIKPIETIPTAGSSIDATALLASPELAIQSGFSHLNEALSGSKLCGQLGKLVSLYTTLNNPEQYGHISGYESFMGQLHSRIKILQASDSICPHCKLQSSLNGGKKYE